MSGAASLNASLPPSRLARVTSADEERVPPPTGATVAARALGTHMSSGRGWATESLTREGEWGLGVGLMMVWLCVALCSLSVVEQEVM